MTHNSWACFWHKIQTVQWLSKSISTFSLCICCSRIFLRCYKVAFTHEFRFKTLLWGFIEKSVAVKSYLPGPFLLKISNKWRVSAVIIRELTGLSFNEDRMGFQCHLCIQHCICECLNRIRKISDGISSRDEQTAKERRLINLTSLVFGNRSPSSTKFFLSYCVNSVSTPGWYWSLLFFPFFLARPIALEDAPRQIDLMLRYSLCAFGRADGIWIRVPAELGSEVCVKWFCCVGQWEKQSCHSLPPSRFWCCSVIVSALACWAVKWQVHVEVCMRTCSCKYGVARTGIRLRPTEWGCLFDLRSGSGVQL